MSDPHRDHRFERSWWQDYRRSRQNNAGRIMPRWLLLTFIVGVALIVGLLFFSTWMP